MTDPSVAFPGGAQTTAAREATILLVEDEPPLLALVQDILVRAGFLVLPAATGIEALSVWEARGGQIDLLLTDMMLPEGMAGWELAARLQAKKSGLKVIFTSGHCFSILGEQTGPLIEGVNFLAKPYRPQNLVKTVRACFESAA